MPEPELAVSTILKLQATGETNQHLQKRTTEFHPVFIYPDISELRPFETKISPVFFSVVVVRNMPDEFCGEQLSKQIPVGSWSLSDLDVRNQAIQPLEVLVVKSPGRHYLPRPLGGSSTIPWTSRAYDPGFRITSHSNWSLGLRTCTTFGSLDMYPNLYMFSWPT